MKNIIVGTAGHIDHGKTTLVKALTGIDTDRLKEEKDRGISIDLGFANLTTAAGNRIAFVDVPGHERFIRNMMAGVSGIDIVLLIVAADEAIKPQTREHFHICRMLGVRRGIVVLTKTDLVEPDWLELVRLEVEEFVEGSFLEGAPILPVSARDGRGLAELVAAVEAAATDLRERSASKIFRLPIDRSFVVRGHGTVVTGTVWEGQANVEQELVVLPGGTPARVRSIQVHGAAVSTALPGQRAALNLAGVDAGSIRRGQVLTIRDGLEPVQRLDAWLELLPQSPPVRDRARVHFHSGTAEVEAEVRLLESQRILNAGQSGFVRFALTEPLLVSPGDRFVIRRASPLETLGGGEVVELHPGTQRLRRVGAAERLRKLKGQPLRELIRQWAAEAPQGIRWPEMVARWGATPADRPADLRSLGDFLVADSRLEAIGRELQAALKAFHASQPLEPGLPIEMVRQRYLGPLPAAALEAILQLTPALKAEGESIRLATHQVRLAGAEDEAGKMIEGLFLSAGLAVPATEQVLAAAPLPMDRARAVLQVLLKQGRLRRVGTEFVFHAQPLQELAATLKSKKGQRFNVSDFKNWTGISRKYAIPLLEFFDRERLTRRDGDFRIVL